jgi:quercetin dioxygenase-like cupin family protein
MATHTTPIHSRTDAEAIALLGEVCAIRLTSEQTGGAVAVMEHLLRRGMATPLHVQACEDELFHVLEGQITVWMDGERNDATAGDVVWLPRDRAHAFRVDSGHARMLGLSVPGGHEKFFRLAGDPAGELDLGADGTVLPDMDRMAAAAAAAHVEILGPPPFETDVETPPGEAAPGYPRRPGAAAQSSFSKSKKSRFHE